MLTTDRYCPPVSESGSTDPTESGSATLLKYTAERKATSESTSIKQREPKYKESIPYLRPGRKEGSKPYQAAQGGWDPCTADTGTSHTSVQRPRHTAH